MRNAGRHPQRGFTLIEVLTVIAIISLLIGVLVPAVSAARNQAKKASTQSMIESLAKGCEMFHRDFERYPRSSGYNPFEPSTPTSGIALSGAQWLILELAGADLKGYVASDKYRYPSRVDGAPILSPSDADWREYYNPNFTAFEFRRYGPYVQLEGKMAQSPGYYKDNTSPTQSLPEVLDPAKAAAGTSDWNNGRLPFAVDAFGFPVLYYVANEQAVLPFSDPDDVPPGGGDPRPGRYTQWDNTPFTGSDYGDIAGIDVGGGTSHPLRWLGWESGTPTAIARQDSFAGSVYDRALHTQNQKVWPHRPDTFLFISAGKDALYGTSDDVANFEN